MKVFFVAFAVVALSNIVVSRDSSKDLLLDKIKNQHVQAYLTHLIENENATAKIDEMCPGGATKIIYGLTSLVECGNRLEGLTVCTTLKNHLLSCSTSLLRAIEECVPQRTKGLPTLILKSMVSTFGYVCGLDGEHIFELWNDCIYNQNVENHNAEVQRCVQKFTRKTQQFQQTLPTTNEICSLATSFRSCFQTYISASCSNQITRSTWTGLFDSLTNPCSVINQVRR